MQHSISFDQGCITVTLSGKADLDGINAFLNDLVKHPEWKSGTKLLLDNRHLNRKKFYNYKGTEAIAGIVFEYREKIPPVRCAAVFDDEDGATYYNLERDILDYHGLRLNTEPFQDLNKAKEWLES